MRALTAKPINGVRAENARVTGGMLRVQLDDRRQISLSFKRVPWLKWPAEATRKQRADWSLEPGGYAIYWEDLDDGIKVCHLLDVQPIK